MRQISFNRAEFRVIIYHQSIDPEDELSESRYNRLNETYLYPRPST